jgi:hypothetical protein
MDLREIGCEDGRWMELAQDRVQWVSFLFFVIGNSHFKISVLRRFGGYDEGRHAVIKPSFNPSSSKILSQWTVPNPLRIVFESGHV